MKPKRTFVDELRLEASKEKPYTEEALKGVVELLTRKLKDLKSSTEGIL